MMKNKVESMMAETLDDNEGRSSTLPSNAPTMVPILLCSCILELLYLVIVALTPLPELHLSMSPLVEAWAWTLLPSHVLFPDAWIPSNNRLPVVLLTVTLLALVGTYAFALSSVLHKQNNSSANGASRRWLLLLIGATILFGLTLLVQPVLFSDDVFTYIFSGRLLTIYHADPLNNAPIQFPYDPYLRWVISGRYTPNIYGPLWLFIASALVSMGNNPVVTLLLFKGVALLAHLTNCVLVWAILSKIAPGRRLLGTLLYAWNPLAVLELAGSGHNEGVLLSILLLATLLYVRWKGRWHEIGVLALLGLAIGMNLIVLLIAPLFLWFMVRTERDTRSALWGFGWRMLLSLTLVLLLYLPFWRGAPTFFDITSAIDMAHFIHSPIGLLIEPTRWIFGLVAQWSHFPPVMQPTTAADSTLRISTIFIFALIYIRLFGKVRHAPSTVAGMLYAPNADQEMNFAGFDALLKSWSSAIFWYLVLVLGQFWPWYILWALWSVSLRRLDARTITVLLLSGTALLTYPLLNFAGLPIAMYQSTFIFGIPLVYLFWNRKKS